MTTIDRDGLRSEIEAAVTDYQRVYPPPHRLAPNLNLAVQALAALDEAEARTRAKAIRDARAAFYELHEVAPTLKGAFGPERVGAHHATNVCMDFLTRYADEQETTR